MIKTPVYNVNGEKVSEVELNPKVFGLAVKPDLVSFVVIAQKANQRQVLAHTKNKGEVRGGGRKPWRQKGTGRARHGSIRSPLWRGGGVTFGPTKERNFSLKINKKEKRQALLMVLSDKAKHEKIILIDKLELDQPKTKKFFQILQNVNLRVKTRKKNSEKKDKDSAIINLPAKKNKAILLVLPQKNQSLLSG